MRDVDSSLSAASVRGPRSAKVGGGKKINLLLVPLFAGWRGRSRRWGTIQGWGRVRFGFRRAGEGEEAAVSDI